MSSLDLFRTTLKEEVKQKKEALKIKRDESNSHFNSIFGKRIEINSKVEDCFNSKKFQKEGQFLDYIRQVNFTMVDSMLKDGVNVNSKNKENETGLIILAQCMCTNFNRDFILKVNRMCELLLKCGASVHERDVCNRDAKDYASFSLNYELFMLLDKYDEYKTLQAFVSGFHDRLGENSAIGTFGKDYLFSKSILQVLKPFVVSKGKQIYEI